MIEDQAASCSSPLVIVPFSARTTGNGVPHIGAMAPPSQRPHLAGAGNQHAGGGSDELAASSGPELPVLSSTDIAPTDDAGIAYVPLPESWSPFTPCINPPAEGTFRWWQQQELVEVAASPNL